MISSLGAAIVSGVLTLLAIFALRPIAVAIDLIDRPGGRKTHHGEVPIIGGIAMFLGLAAGLSFLDSSNGAIASFEGACALLVIVGLLDDRFQLSPWTRLVAHAAAALMLITGSGTVVTSLGDVLGNGPVSLGGPVSVAFTVLAIAGAINAFNMMDGLDGLAGATAAMCLAAFSFMAAATGALDVAAIAVVVIGAICAFLVFNFPSKRNRTIRCFMGDAGSTLLGFTCAWVCIRLTQGSPSGLSVPPVVALWVLALPVGELCWSTIRRLMRRTSPFSADANHFHHLLMAAGYGVRGTFFIAVAISLAFISAGLTLWYLDVPDYLSFGLLILAEAGMVTFMYHPGAIRSWVPESFIKLPEDPDPTGKFPKPEF